MIRIRIKRKISEQQSSQNIDKSSFALLKTSDTKYILYDAKKLIDFCASLPKDNPDFDEKELIDNNIVIAYSQVTESDNLKKRLKVNCMNATEISVAALNPNLKGSRLGEYLMRVIISLYPEGVIGDRGSISPSARAAMKRIAGLAKVKTLNDPDTGEKVDKLDNVDNPKTKTKLDDCPVYLDLDSDFIDRAYIYKDSSINPQDLLDKNQLSLQTASEATDNNWTPDSLEYALRIAGIKLYHMQTEIP